MSREFSTILYAALCACFGLSPSSSGASVLIREAYQASGNMSIPGPAGKQPGEGRRRLDLEPGGTQECIRFRKGKKQTPVRHRGAV